MEEKHWYEVKASYKVLTGENPTEHAEVLLVGAVTFAEAEELAANEVATEADRFDIEVKACAIRKYGNIIRMVDAEQVDTAFYKCRVLVATDDLRMKPEASLIEAVDFSAATDRIADFYSRACCDFEIDSVQKTQIKNVIGQ